MKISFGGKVREVLFRLVKTSSLSAYNRKGSLKVGGSAKQSKYKVILSNLSYSLMTSAGNSGSLNGLMSMKTM